MSFRGEQGGSRHVHGVEGVESPAQNHVGIAESGSVMVPAVDIQAISVDFQQEEHSSRS